VSALATECPAMDTLFDPDELIERSRPDALRSRPDEPIERSRPDALDARSRLGEATPDRAASESRASEADEILGTTPGEVSVTVLDAGGGGPRLDDLVTGLWEGLAAHRVVECPLCGSEMRPVYAAHALPIGGRCVACASTLG
jgi:hypothetical protein